MYRASSPDEYIRESAPCGTEFLLCSFDECSSEKCRQLYYYYIDGKSGLHNYKLYIVIILLMYVHMVSDLEVCLGLGKPSNLHIIIIIVWKLYNYILTAST